MALTNGGYNNNIFDLPKKVNDEIAKLNQEIKSLKLEIAGGLSGLRNARATFGETKYGRPSKRIIKPIQPELPPQKITDENYFFMTGTMPKNSHIHTDKCGEQCKDCKCKKG